LPGQPDESELYQRVRDGEMPPKDQKPHPGPGDLAVLRQWIEAGAPAPAAAGRPRSYVSDSDVHRLIQADLQNTTPRQRRFVRYFPLTHLHNAGRPDAELERVRLALSKLLNSLSWHPRISRPQPLDAARTVLRMDLRDYQWSARLWDRVLSFYPYLLADRTRDAKAISAATR